MASLFGSFAPSTDPTTPGLNDLSVPYGYQPGLLEQLGLMQTADGYPFYAPTQGGPGGQTPQVGPQAGPDATAAPAPMPAPSAAPNPLTVDPAAAAPYPDQLFPDAGSLAAAPDAAAPVPAPSAPAADTGLAGALSPYLYAAAKAPQVYDKLMQTWPGRAATDLVGAIKTLADGNYAPGVRREDVTDIPPPSGPTADSTMIGQAFGLAPAEWQPNDKYIQAATDAAGLAMGGAYAAPAVEGAAGMGIRAYHGSPHDFDRFDLSKIGTGEGAQSYGHGLYFAENEGVARTYRDALSGRNDFVTADGERISDPALANTANNLLRNGFTPERMSESIEKSINNLKTGPVKDSFYAQQAIEGNEAELARVRQLLGKNIANDHNPGRMYEVNINADPAHFLDWDKPIGEQGELIQRAVPPLNVSARSIGANPNLGEELFDVAAKGGGSLGTFPKSRLDEVMSNPSKFDPRTGGMVYENALQNRTKHRRDVAADTTAALRDAGIPGIKYLDQGSRGPAKIYNVGAPTQDFGPYSAFTTRADAESHANMLRRQGFQNAEIKEQAQPQSSNYVVFNDKIVDILKKYGLAGIPGAAAAAHQMAHTDDVPFGSLAPGNQ